GGALAGVEPPDRDVRDTPIPVDHVRLVPPVDAGAKSLDGRRSAPVSRGRRRSASAAGRRRKPSCEQKAEERAPRDHRRRLSLSRRRARATPRSARLAGGGAPPPTPR